MFPFRAERMLYYKTYHHSENADWVVFVHGAGGSSTIWFRQIQAFRQEYNVLLVDLRGHGGSRDMLQKYYQEEYSFKMAARDILVTLEEAGIKKAHFVGVSLGTIIIRTIGELQPGLIQSMVLCGAVTRLNIRSRVLIFLGQTFKRFVPFMWLYKLFAWIIMPRRRHSESRYLFIREARKLYRREFLKWFKLTYEVNPLLRYFREKELDVPTLYIMGQEDHLFLPPVRKLVREHKHATLEIIERCGHVCNVEKPEIFNRLSLNFLGVYSFSG